MYNIFKMKFRKFCSVLGGILYLIFAASLLALALAVLFQATSCFGFVADGGETGNEDLGTLGLIFAGPFMLIFFIVALIFIAIPSCIFICAGVQMVKINPTTPKHPVSPIVALLILLGVTLFVFLSTVDQPLKNILLATYGILFLMELPLTIAAYSLIKKQNAELNKRAAEEREKLLAAKRQPPAPDDKDNRPND